MTTLTDEGVGYFKSRWALADRATIALVGIVAIFVAVNARWVWLYRHGQPLDIDEAGYLTIAMSDYYGYVNGGVLGWLSAINGPSSQAPFLPSLASILFILFGPNISLGFAASILCDAALIVVAYSLGREVGSKWIGLIASSLVATTPAVVMFSRAFEFVPAATLTCTLALLCLLKSDRMRDARWAFAFAVAVAMMPLSRTMTLGFLPGVFLGATLYVAADRRDRVRRLTTLLFAFVIAIAIAAIWFVPNGKYVFPYLLHFGYGARAVEYGPGHVSIFALSGWQLTLREIAFQYMRLPHALIVLCGLASAIAFSIIDGGSPKSLMLRALKSPVLPLIVFVAGGIAALSSTSNRGSGFPVPLFPSIVILASIGLYRLSILLPRFSVATAVGLVCCFAAFPFLDLGCASLDKTDIPFLGPVALFDGRAPIQIYEHGRGEKSDDGTDVQPFSISDGNAWLRLSELVASKYKDPQGIVFGMRHILFNTNTVSLAEMQSGSLRPIYQLDPASVEDNVDAYLAWLNAAQIAGVCTLFTATKNTGGFRPSINISVMQDAASMAGFLQQESFEMPNKGDLIVWRRNSSSCDHE